MQCHVCRVDRVCVLCTGNSPATGLQVLITGITGMIGSAVAQVCVRQPNTKVHGLVRWRSSLHNLNKVLLLFALGQRLWDAVRARWWMVWQKGHPAAVPTRTPTLLPLANLMNGANKHDPLAKIKSLEILCTTDG